MKNTIKVVYVTGCLGFIGRYITTACLEAGWFVYGIDKITYAADANLINHFSEWNTFKFEQKDINDIDFLYDCDYIINTAAETHVGNSIVKSDEFIHSNVTGVHHLLELLKEYRLESGNKPTLIHFSTDEVYGDISEGRHTELDMLKPSNPYAATKAAADMLIKAWGRTYDIPYIIVRPTNNYGLGQYVEKLIPKTIKYLTLGRRIPLHNNGTPTRNWLHAKDTANAIITIIESGITNEIFNICGGFEQSNIDTVSKIIHTYFDNNDIEINDYLDLTITRKGQDVRYSLDDTKLRNLGWTPEHIFDDELELIVNYYKNNFIW